ncbi:hypothetical protein TcasGA2_TC034591 [Tribolium castaneum]|uniref:Uncharacterized protein n=1 Tax=Tribolium castaneum TaxID=7070 RepID=A0A139WKW2_TRICA|nr:hypothetical protein TcasGA2_TC034591 [Tribolium castaneum]
MQGVFGVLSGGSSVSPLTSAVSVVVVEVVDREDQQLGGGRGRGRRLRYRPCQRPRRGASSRCECCVVLTPNSISCRHCFKCLYFWAV